MTTCFDDIVHIFEWYIFIEHFIEMHCVRIELRVAMDSDNQLSSTTSHIHAKRALNRTSVFSETFHISRKKKILIVRTFWMCDWKGLCNIERSCILRLNGVKEKKLLDRDKYCELWPSSVQAMAAGPLTCITTYRRFHVYFVNDYFLCAICMF